MTVRHIECVRTCACMPRGMRPFVPCLCSVVHRCQAGDCFVAAQHIIMSACSYIDLLEKLVTNQTLLKIRGDQWTDFAKEQDRYCAQACCSLLLAHAARVWTHV